MIIELATLETGSLMPPKQELNAGRILTLSTFTECFSLHAHNIDIVVTMQHGSRYSDILQPCTATTFCRIHVAILETVLQYCND